MKNLRVLLLVVLCIALTSAAGYTKNAGSTYIPRERLEARTDVPELGLPVNAPRAAVQAGTTFLGSWSFDSGPHCVTSGWTSVDITVQTGDYWHVDDFAGLGGGSYGLLNPLEGAKSMWCGARPDQNSSILCSYAVLPGYGNSWDQMLCSACFAVTGDVVLTFLVSWDSEPGWDATTVEYDACDGTWLPVATAANGGLYDNYSFSVVDTAVVAAAEHSGSVRFRFYFASDGAWSDEDGLWNTDGAIILDSLTVADGTGVLGFEDFEAAAVGDNGAGDWNSCNLPGYGDFAALYAGLELLQEDPCAQDLDCMWTFFTGSTYDYSCAGHPSVPTIPYENTRGQYMSNEVWSPLIPWTGVGATAEVAFNVYRDLTRDAAIRYVWHVRSWVNDCAQPWRDEGYVYYGPRGIDWLSTIQILGDKIAPGATHIQIALGVVDMCPYWCPDYTGQCHSPAPYFDDVVVYRVATVGPQWIVRDIDLFQDSFAGDGTTTGTVRVDMAQDILVRTNPNILPGDSAVVQVSDPESGLATDPYTGFGAAVYGFVRVDPPQPSKSGWSLTDDVFRWPLVDSTVTSDGNKWYMVRMDTAFTQPSRTGAAPDRFCLDLNDNLLTPGDTLWFFFGARSDDAAGSWVYYFHEPRATENAGIGAVLTTDDIDEASNNAEEMTCLPAAGLLPGSDILYVDDFSGRGAQPYFDTAFRALGVYEKVDRYDIRGPSSTVDNGLQSRVTDVYQQLIPIYKKIIWNSGNLDAGLIGDTQVGLEKTDDYAVLFTFVDQSNRNPGLWINGDYNAWEWTTLGTPSPTQLRSAYMNFNLLDIDHGQLGLPLNPTVVGAPLGAFDNITGPDTLIAYGGCAGINEFDVLEPTGLSRAEAYYEGNPAFAAVLSQRTINAAGFTASVMLSGFSFHYIRDDRPADVMDRVIHLQKVLAFLGNTTDDPVAADPARYYDSLSQNRPNPFNPTTTIEFTVKDRTDVQLRIYNVAGQLVRTLVDEVKAPGEVHAATWDGRNDAGQSVSSGVYFYKLVAGSFVQTKKMVLLK